MRQVGRHFPQTYHDKEAYKTNERISEEQPQRATTNKCGPRTNDQASAYSTPQLMVDFVSGKFETFSIRDVPLSLKSGAPSNPYGGRSQREVPQRPHHSTPCHWLLGRS